MITPVLINRIGWKTYLIFMILLALFVPFVYFCYPETSGLSLEEIDNLFLPADKQVRQLSFSAEGGVRRSLSNAADYDKGSANMVEKV